MPHKVELVAFETSCNRSKLVWLRCLKSMQPQLPVWFSFRSFLVAQTGPADTNDEERINRKTYNYLLIPLRLSFIIPTRRPRSHSLCLSFVIVVDLIVITSKVPNNK